MLATPTKQRITFSNILLATDYSKTAYAAMTYAGYLARAFEASLYAMHVNEPFNYASPPEMCLCLQTPEEMERDKFCEELRRMSSEITLKFLEGEGDIWTALAIAIAEHKVDLLVIGTRGRTGLEKAFLGSRAEEILRRARCPVLTVGPKTNVQATQGRLTSILYATDFGLASLKASRIAVSLAEECQAKLTLLNVLNHCDSHYLELRKEFGETSERRLRELVPEEANLWCTPHFVLESGNPAEKILEVAEREKAELIVLGAHMEEGIPGASTHLPTATIHRIVAHANCPVLTIRG